MRILVACEYSATVRDAFRKLGHDAWSCDLLPCDGDPKWHYQCDVFDVINEGWDMMIAHPPCTYLTVSGNKWMKPEFSSRFPTRIQDREDALLFVQKLLDADIPKIALENPIGVISSRIRKPDQIVQPWQFGHPEPKSTCLWLKNLPKLNHTNVVEPEFIIGKRDGKKYSRIHYMSVSKGDRWKIRSKTYQGIADAMAEQWGLSTGELTD